MKNKYLKYKIKYLELKNNMHGGVLPEPISNPAPASHEPEVISDEVEVTPKIIGQGTIGCVYKPTFKCRHPDECVSSPGSAIDRCKYGVGKVMDEEYANLEYEKYDILDIDNIDPAFRYHFKKPHKCIPVLREEDLVNCRAASSNPSMLIYDNGEKDLYTLLNEIYSGVRNDIKTQQIKEVLRKLLNIVEGIRLFNQNGVCHFDIKTQNITTSIPSIDLLERLDMKLIDFGMSLKYNMPITPVNIFNGINGYSYEHVKTYIQNYYAYFSMDTLFIGLLDKTVKLETDKAYIIKVIEEYLDFFYTPRHGYASKYILINEWYRQFKEEQIIDELLQVYEEHSIQDIILNYLQSHDSFHFALVLIEICSKTTDAQINRAARDFIYNSKALDFNPYSRCKSTDLLHYYTLFLRQIGML